MKPDIVTTFYTCFEEMDAEGMAGCYHPEVVFEDPAFGQLTGVQASNMWRMLIDSQKGKDFRIAFSQVSTEETSGRAQWEAWYDFPQTGRPVHNVIQASFGIKDGKIIRHIDSFDLYRWSRMALGLQGTLIGWTPFFKKKLQQQTRKMLRRYESKMNSNNGTINKR